MAAEGLSQSEAVIKTIMERRSIRQYKPQAVNRDTMQTILKCGINAPNQPRLHQRCDGALQESQSESDRRPVVQEHVP